jgi:CRP/FNR family cyclic AMP-dependent transcriptional regulator
MKSWTRRGPVREGIPFIFSRAALYLKCKGGVMQGLKKEDYSANLAKIAMFKYFTPDAMREIQGKAEILSFSEGEPIIAQGDKNPYFYAVLKGTVNVTVREKEKEVFVSTIGEGEVFGEAGIFLNVERTANVVSAADSVIMRISRNNLLSFIKTRPTDGIKLLMIIVYTLLKKLRNADLELAFERKDDSGQDEIDSMVKQIMAEQ